MYVKQCTFATLILLASAHSHVAGDTCQSLVPPEIPEWNRGIVDVWTEPGPTAGLHSIFAKVAFESDEIIRVGRDLSVHVLFLINGETVMDIPRTLVVVAGSGTACLDPPCDDAVCGSVSTALAVADIYCRETSICEAQPMSCECRCGDVLTLTGPQDQDLDPGDELTVVLRPAAGSQAEVYTPDDSRTVPFYTRAPHADFTGDGMVTLADYTQFASCITGPIGRLPDGCGQGDFDQDGNIDLKDVGTLQLSYTGFVIPCWTGSLNFHWPMPGVDARDWVINNYVDLDPGDGKTDFRGNTGDDAKTYNGHKGVDVDVPTFRAMDNDFPIFAAASGFVVYTHDTEYDRHMGDDTGPWNVVKIEHPNGFVSYYGHLKENSVVVSPGDHVVPGQKLGVVGSSGNSSHPHLHFEVHDCDGDPVAPFLHDMILNPPLYDTPLGFMDATLINGVISDVEQIQDPPPNVKVIQPGDTLGFGASMAGGEGGDSTTVTIRRPNNTEFSVTNWNWGVVYRHSFWLTNPVIDEPSIPLGLWTAEVRTNDSLS